MAAVLISILANPCSADPLRRYVAAQHTCAELQALLRKDGRLNLIHPIGYGTTFLDPKSCAQLGKLGAVRVYERSLDKLHCLVGYRCWIP